MPALDLAQEELGYLTPEAMSEVATALELDPGYVEGVATFYSLFHHSPVGKHRFYVCTNLSCTLRGANEIVDHFKKVVGVKEPVDVSSDGLFSFEEVECLGACEYAPMMRLDQRYHYELTAEKIDQLVSERRSGSPLPTAAPHPPASPATSPASGEVTTPRSGPGTPPHPPASPATSPASGEVLSPNQSSPVTRPKRTRKKAGG
jgi:NADH-quinone oxidoreductase subunit E